MGKKCYHIWFQTKCRKRVLVDDIDKYFQQLLAKIAEDKHLTLLAYGTMPEHVHLLISIDFGELSYAIKMFKGISSRRIFQHFPALKFQFHINNLWARSYGYNEIPTEKIPVVIDYVNNQKDHLCVPESPHFNAGCSSHHNDKIPRINSGEAGLLDNFHV